MPYVHGIKRALAMTVMLSVYWTIQVCQAAPTVPDSGSLLQQNQQSRPVPVPNNDTGLKIEKPAASDLPSSAPFRIDRIEISGNTLFGNETLHALVADLEGGEHTLGQLNDAVNKISDFYHARGYPLARAYVPAQTLQNGVVKIVVIEARYGEIHLDNSSLVQDSVLEATLHALHAGDTVEQTRLDRTLLLLSDIPGLNSSATLEPGQSVGTSDLVVQATATPEWNGNALLDNYGNAYTGRARLSGTLNWIDPLQHGDVASANLLSAGRDMDSASLTYETLVSGQGTRVGAMTSFLHYRLGLSLDKLEGHGTAGTGSLWLKYPWNRSMDVNVTTQLQLDYKNLKDEIDSTGIKTDRHSDAISLSLNGDVNSNVLAGAQTLWSVSWKGGEVNFDNAAAQALDQTSANVEGGFFKLNANYSRLQNFTQDTALYLAMSVQLTNGNLDSSEKMPVGGTYSVRAYDMGVLSGDSGLLRTVELRQMLGNWLGGPWQAIAFVDSQHIRINQNPWSTSSGSANSAGLMGAGLGLGWANDSGWHMKISAAAPAGSVPQLLNTKKSVRLWAELGVFF